MQTEVNDIFAEFFIAAGRGDLHGVARFINESRSRPVFTAVYFRAILSAASNGHLDTIKYILHNCGQHVDLSACYNIIVKTADRQGHADIVRFLFENGGRKISFQKNRVEQMGLFHMGKYMDRFNQQMELIVRLERERGNGEKFFYENPEKCFIDTVQAIAANGFLDVIRYLVEDRRIDINVFSSTLNEAAYNGHLPMLRYLIEESRKDANYRNMCEKVLLLATENGHLDIVMYLAGIGVLRGNGTVRKWAIQGAAINGHLSVMKYLLKQRLSIEFPKISLPFLVKIAVVHGHLDVVKYLAEEYGQVGAASLAFDKIVIAQAAANGHLAVIQYLIGQRRTKINFSRGNIKSRTEIKVLLKEAIYNGRLDIIDYLAQTCDGVNVAYYNNYALVEAACKGRLAEVRFLVEESGRHIDVTAFHNFALTTAARGGYLAIIKFLVEESGQDVDIAAQNHEALNSATVYKNFAVISYLLEVGYGIATEGLSETQMLMAAEFCPQLTDSTVNDQRSIRSALNKLRQTVEMEEEEWSNEFRKILIDTAHKEEIVACIQLDCLTWEKLQEIIAGPACNSGKRTMRI